MNVKTWSSLLIITISSLLAGVFLFFIAVKFLLDLSLVSDEYHVVRAGVSAMPGYYLILIWSQILIVIGTVLQYICFLPMARKNSTVSSWYERGTYFSLLLLPCMWLVGENSGGNLIVNIFAPLWMGSFSNYIQTTYLMNHNLPWSYIEASPPSSSFTAYGHLGFVSYLFLFTGTLLLGALWRFRRKRMSKTSFSILIAAASIPFGGFLTLNILSLINGGISVLPYFIPIPHTILVSILFLFKGPITQTDADSRIPIYRTSQKSRLWGLGQTGRTNQDILEVKLSNMHSKRGEKEDRR
ncbi:MAG: hypothetical protein ACFFEK_13390 [Candidatus Thorarchaeota archaeon]